MSEVTEMVCIIIISLPTQLSLSTGERNIKKVRLSYTPPEAAECPERFPAGEGPNRLCKSGVIRPRIGGEIADITLQVLVLQLLARFHPA